MNYRDMNDEQMLAWGEGEHKARIADLSVRSREGLFAAQANAERRRKLIGATKGQAANMVLLYSRDRRIDAARAALSQGGSNGK